MSYDASGDPSGITTSRLNGYLVDQHSVYSQMSAIHASRKLAKDIEVQPATFAYAESFIFTETELIIMTEMVQNFILDIISVAFISLLFLINPIGVCFVISIIIMVDVCILGFVNFWNLKVNTVTVVQFVMAVGLVVDYNAHIIHYYLELPKHLSPEVRVVQTLRDIGLSVALGCCTTFLGIVPLAFASSVIFAFSFKCFC